MAVNSSMLDLGTIAPDFTLFDTVSGKNLSLNELKSDKGTLVMFICNHCPYVVHLNKSLAEFGREYSAKGISVIAISANNIATHPMDGPEFMKKNAAEQGFTFPYLYDESQEIARAYKAECTPDFYLFDGNLILVYRGQYDDSRPNNLIPITGKDLKNACDALLNGSQINENQIPSIGCGIKWK